MNSSEAKRRPLLCVVNGPRIRDLIGKSNLDCRIETFEAGRVPDWPAHFDAVNPDCVVIGLDEPPAETIEDPEAWVEFREYCETRHIPVVGVGDRIDPELRAALLADAYLHPLDGGTLRRHVEKLLRRRERILDQILIDPVTGAFNARYLRREVDLQLFDIKRSHETFSLVYLEADRLGSGPETERAARLSLVRFIRRNIRPTDCLAHHAEGGFVLVLPKTVKEDALKLIHRLTRSFSEAPIDTPDGVRHATFSAKIREFADPGMTGDDCLALMPFTDADPQDRRGLVLDASDAAVRKLMVAVIDDDRLIRELLNYQLADIGEDLYEVEVRTFADGEAFFSDPWHRQNERYLVIIDRIMPKMDGLEVLSRIREGYDRRRYVCVMVSSKGAETDITMAIQRGANDYMVKPFSLKELRARIGRLIGGLR